MARVPHTQRHPTRRGRQLRWKDLVGPSQHSRVFIDASLLPPPDAPENEENGEWFQLGGTLPVKQKALSITVETLDNNQFVLSYYLSRLVCN